MNKEPACSICNAPMYSFERLPNRTTRKKNSIKVFRYECCICERTELRFTEHRIAESPEFEHATQKEVEKLNIQQEENNY